MSLRASGRTYGALASNLKRLVAAIKQYLPSLPDVSAEIAEVEAAVAEVEDAMWRQDRYLALRTQATKDVKAALTRGKQAGVRLQNAVRFKFGTKDERLTEFLIKPQRKRRTKKETAESSPRAAAREESSRTETEAEDAKATGPVSMVPTRRT